LLQHILNVAVATICNNSLKELEREREREKEKMETFSALTNMKRGPVFRECL